MEIRINGKQAALKKGTSFDYVAENRLFSGSDGYTLSITFPLKDCPENIAIFGNINRKDVSKSKVIFDCEIRDRGFYKFGSVTITEITATEVKVQFLEGRSEQNFDTTFDDIYINELSLGDGSLNPDGVPEYAWDPVKQSMKCVALPWVNDYSGNIQNLVDYDSSTGRYSWNKDCKGRSWQPYLLYITKQICSAEGVGYSYDFSAWEAREEFRYLLICNCLPWAWDLPDFARALPHWTVAEFFEKLELFLNGEFTIDHRAKRITFAFTEAVLDSQEPVKLENVIDEHTTEVTIEEDKCEYREAKNLYYKECDHQMWKFYSCDWFINTWKNYSSSFVSYNNMRELLAANARFRKVNQYGRGSNSIKLLYAKDIDTYFIMRALYKTLVYEYPLISGMPNTYQMTMELRPLNIFGGRVVDESEDADELEIEFVPVCIDFTEEKYGNCMFLSFSGYDETDTTESSFNWNIIERKREIDATLFQPRTVQALEAGEEKKVAEYYDRIYIGWWNGALDLAKYGKLPHPYAEDLEVLDDWSNYSNLHFSLRLNRNTLHRSGSFHSVNPKIKTTFKFLSDTIPSPRAVFYIHGKRYLCEKITATFTENGMSQLLTGVFWPILD